MISDISFPLLSVTEYNFEVFLATVGTEFAEHYFTILKHKINLFFWTPFTVQIRQREMSKRFVSLSLGLQEIQWVCFVMYCYKSALQTILIKVWLMSFQLCNNIKISILIHLQNICVNGLLRVSNPTLMFWTYFEVKMS